MDGKRLSVTGLGATLRRLALTAGIGGCALLGTGATATTALPAISLHLAPVHLVGVTSGHGGGGASATSSVCWASSNWSGYALSTSSPSGLPCVPGSGVHYASVTGHWTVPAVTAGSRSTYSAVWTGIDGFTNSNLIQSGTEQDVINGRTVYDAWWEILPAAETVIPTITVLPGDSITVNIHQVSGIIWSISLTDNGKTGHPAQAPFSITQSYTGSGTSAEWVVEAPTVGGRQSTIANYGQAIFDDGTVNGSPVVLQNGTSGELVQKSRFGTQVTSIASAPDTGSPAADGFAAAYGSTAPAAPNG